MAPAATGKRGALSGGSLAQADVFASSGHLLAPTRNGGTRGLQQYFTPPEVSALAEAVFGLRNHDVFDPTAGNGALLTSAAQGQRFGVEIDPDQVGAGNYTAIRGDIQRVFPLLRAANVNFSRIVANPPFGLDDWRDPVLSGGKRINSTLLTWRYCMKLLKPGGVGIFVAGRERFERLIAFGKQNDCEPVVLRIAIDDLFEGVSLPCVIALFADPSLRTGEATSFDATRAQLSDPAFIAQMREAFSAGVSFFTRLADSTREREVLNETFELIQQEYDRRVADRGLSQKHDVMLADGKLSVKPSPYAQLALRRSGDLSTLLRLHKQPVSYFGLNIRDWHTVCRHVRDGVLTIDERAVSIVEAEIERGRIKLRPMYPIPTQMRLGFLDDLDQIQCIKDDGEKGFEAGQWYPLSVRSQVVKNEETRIHEGRNGQIETRRFTRERKLLEIRIERATFDESAENIRYISEHFELPQPGDLASNHPEELEAAKRVLTDIANENLRADFTGLDEWQTEDLARCIIKERALLAWSQGGGKSLGQFYFAEACIRLGKAKRDVALFVAPQDLHDQWRRELAKFLGNSDRTLESIQTPADAERVRRHIKAGGTGWYITHYEALSLIGTAGTELLPHRVIESRGRSVASAEDTDGQAQVVRTTEEACPACLADHDTGWSGIACRKCGYNRYRVRVKSVASRLATAFKEGVICVDELSMVRGDSSRRSLALRGMRAACRLGASGTPISNYINDCFWGLSWCIGWGSARFPYDYEGGKAKFEADFCVIEHMMGRKDEGEENQRKRRKILPEVTNLSMLWKLLSVNMVRRRQRDMGEMVKRTFHTIELPMGTAQQKMNRKWFAGFAGFFAAKHPGHPLVEAGMVEKFQAALGLLWKLEYAATLPEQDPDGDWHGIDVSNFTPKLVKALEIIEERVQAGEKVLVGSCLIETGPLIAELLFRRGIKTAHITESAGYGKAKTKNPRARARAVTDFVTGDTQVLCAGVQAMKLGHNLDVASTVLLLGFPWSYEAFDQFLARVWRRTSKKPVSVYCLITNGSIDQQKYKLLADKAAASDVALDGRLVDEPEKTVDWNKILAEMAASGIGVTGQELDELDLRRQWFDHVPEAPPQTPASPLTPTTRAGGLEPSYNVEVAVGAQTALFV